MRSSSSTTAPTTAASNCSTKSRSSDPHLTVIQLRRNFGQTAAFSAGFDHARGDVIITMDADLQNDPNDIPLLMAKIDEGYDIVSGWRKDRQDRFLDRRLPSMIANRMISNVTDVRLHDYGCSLKAYRADVLQHVHLYGELHRFIPALASQVGGTVTEVPVNHHARQYGTSKYGIGRTVRVVLDLITVWFLGSYATRPIHVFGTLGLISAGLGFLHRLYLTFVKFGFGQRHRHAAHAAAGRAAGGHRRAAHHHGPAGRDDHAHLL